MKISRGAVLDNGLFNRHRRAADIYMFAFETVSVVVGLVCHGWLDFSVYKLRFELFVSRAAYLRIDDVKNVASANADGVYAHIVGQHADFKKELNAAVLLGD